MFIYFLIGSVFGAGLVFLFLKVTDKDDHLSVKFFGSLLIMIGLIVLWFPCLIVFLMFILTAYFKKNKKS